MASKGGAWVVEANYSAPSPLSTLHNLSHPPELDLYCPEGVPSTSSSNRKIYSDL